jgi:hypothetical protein
MTTITNISTVQHNLENFIETQTQNYLHKLQQIQLFLPSTQLNHNQIDKFCKIFYHIRGHFSQFLFLIGSFASDNRYKQVVLNNLQEEFSDDLDSHEVLYIKFCESLGVNIVPEIIHPSNNLEWVQQFNRGHLVYLYNHNWQSKWAAFSAYEALDNHDYNLLYQLESKFNNKANLIFFAVHKQAGHFDSTCGLIKECWESDSEAVKVSFDFILSHQLKMWQNLSNEILQ